MEYEKVNKNEQICEDPLSVLRGSNSQKKVNEVGIHWFRCSSNRLNLKDLLQFCGIFFGVACKDDYAQWFYSSRYRWQNGATLNFDDDYDRAMSVHKGKICLDIPGGVLDSL